MGSYYCRDCKAWTGNWSHHVKSKFQLAKVVELKK